MTATATGTNESLASDTQHSMLNCRTRMVFYLYAQTSNRHQKQLLPTVFSAKFSSAARIQSTWELKAADRQSSDAGRRFQKISESY